MKFCPICNETFPAKYVTCPFDSSGLRLQIAQGDMLLGKYRIISEIARGGFGTVYRARQDDLGLDFALKVGANPGDDSFLAEAKILLKLNHPKIVRMQHVDRIEGGLPVIVMELNRR